MCKPSAFAALPCRYANQNALILSSKETFIDCHLKRLCRSLIVRCGAIGEFDFDRFHGTLTCILSVHGAEDRNDPCIRIS